ncbi:MAG: hypothetical protein U0840_23825 [Gemmataceae bacterium]
MARCPSCDYPISDNRDLVGARCPSCHDPLYEPPARVTRQARPGEASCVTHPGAEAVGQCHRCRRHLCETCRTRWRGQILCASCVDRALETREARPAALTELRRQALTSVVFSATAWLTAGLALVLLLRYEPAGRTAGISAAFAVAVLAAGNVLLASLGVGMGAAVVRAGPSQRQVALVGLALGSLYIAVALGLGALGLWKN